MIINANYKVKEDIEFFLKSNLLTIEEFSKNVQISKKTLYNILKDNPVSNEILEKIYAYIYNCKYRLNRVKEELLKESNKKIIFHGSKFGIADIDANGSRLNCDFGNGFYLGETYNQALSFVFENKNSSIYSFEFNTDGLNILELDTTLEWMLVICYYRGIIKKYENNSIVKNIIAKIEQVDVIIAPIADNKMFYIMSLFTQGDINADVALHSLSASSLGKQYVLKTEKAISKLKFIEKYFISNPEREDEYKYFEERTFEIDTKLKLSKREFKDGKFIEEILL